jgi:hypothetical protein
LQPDAQLMAQVPITRMETTKNGMGMSAMAPLQSQLALERQRDLLAVAAAERDANLARLRRRITRQAERAEKRQLSQRDQAIRLRARLEQLGSVR